MPGMMEKGPELLGKNRSANGSAKSPAGGGGSGASSTNGGLHFSEPESGCSSDDEHDVGMRVGAEYQARIPEFDPGATKYTDKDNGGMLVWSPYHSIPDAKLDEYIAIAKEKHGYNVEQALGMLFWHKHNIEKSLADLPNFTPFPDEWTVEDKVLFEQAFSFHGKSFHRIQQMLPDKTIASLVKYYYSWKKTRSRTSLMDRQARKLANRHNQGDSDDDVEETHPMDGNDSDYDPKKEAKKEVLRSTQIKTMEECLYGLRITVSQMPNWMNILQLQRRNMATMWNRHLACCSGINITLRSPLLISLISLPFRMSGQWKIKSSLNKPLVFMGRAFTGFSKCFQIRQLLAL